MTVENARKLIGAGFADPLAKEIARAIDAGSEDYRRLMALGVPGLLAEAMADAIGGEEITAQRLIRLGMNAEQAKIFIIVAGEGSPPADDWILALGAWNDNGVWEDAALWKDAA